MRAATFAMTVVAVGTYLAIAAVLGLSMAWIGLGILGIALTGAIAMVAVHRPAGATS